MFFFSFSMQSRLILSQRSQALWSFIFSNCKYLENIETLFVEAVFDTIFEVISLNASYKFMNLSKQYFQKKRKKIKKPLTFKPINRFHVLITIYQSLDNKRMFSDTKCTFLDIICHILIFSKAICDRYDQQRTFSYFWIIASHFV